MAFKIEQKNNTISSSTSNLLRFYAVIWTWKKWRYKAYGSNDDFLYILKYCLAGRVQK